MYSPFALGWRYLGYWLRAVNGKGHGVHSPFVYDFVRSVLLDKTPYPAYTEVEGVRRKLLQDMRTISVADYGAGSGHLTRRDRRIADIARTSLKPAKYAQLLHRMAQRYRPRTIVELGTSFGVSTSYMAFGNPAAQVITGEGSPSIADTAAEVFRSLQLDRVELVRGNFDETIPAMQEACKHPPELLFLDGNHRLEPTLRYFEQWRTVAAPDAIWVFDDIHWSAEMEAAWEALKAHPAVTLHLDLFFVGIISLNPDFKQQFGCSIRF